MSDQQPAFGHLPFYRCHRSCLSPGKHTTEFNQRHSLHVYAGSRFVELHNQRCVAVETLLGHYQKTAVASTSTQSLDSRCTGNYNIDVPLSTCSHL
jgi:hypothetical protein